MTPSNIVIYVHRELKVMLIEAAKKKAEELDANAIVGMKIVETSHGTMVFYGAAIRVLNA